MTFIINRIAIETNSAHFSVVFYVVSNLAASFNSDEYQLGRIRLQLVRVVGIPCCHNCCTSSVYRVDQSDDHGHGNGGFDSFGYTDGLGFASTASDDSTQPDVQCG